MQHRVLHAAGLFLFLTAGFVTGATPDAAPGDVVRKTDHGFINWTTLTLHAESSRIWDGRAGTALAARGPAYTALHRQTLALLHHTLFTLPVDGRTTLAGLSEETDEPGQTLENMVHERSFSWIPFHAKNGQVRMGLAFRLMERGVLTSHEPIPDLRLPPGPGRSLSPLGSLSMHATCPLSRQGHGLQCQRGSCLRDRPYRPRRLCRVTTSFF